MLDFRKFMRIVNAAQMRAADRQTIEQLGLSSLILMENAGRQVVAVLQDAFADLASRRVAVVSGRGNNGGDGFVVARTLRQRQIDVLPLLVGPAADVQGDARVNLTLLAPVGLSLIEIPDETAWRRVRDDVARAGVIVDAIFGTGLNKPLEGLFRTIVADLNGFNVPIVSIDLPSGFSADDPQILGETIDASITVTLGAPKLPLVLWPGKSRTGKLVVADIGIPPHVIEELDGPYVNLFTREQAQALLPARVADSHKGDYGRVLIVAGSPGKSGAARLSALGALRSGAGLVTVATPRSCQHTVAALAPEYMTEGLPETPDGSIDGEALDRVLGVACDVVAAGPGLGTGAGTSSVVHGLVERASVPLVLDADALNVFASDPDRLRGRPDAPIVVTPHPGEMARLTGTSASQVQADRIGTARSFATSHAVFVVLKGAQTIVAAPNGRVTINPTGNPGMATGGTGDVLTGMIAAWLAQLGDPERACGLAVYLHGLAGDLAAGAVGEVSLIATDLVGQLGPAILSLMREASAPGDS